MKKKANISVIVRVTRAALGMSQGEFGELLSCSKSAVWKWEHEEATPRGEKLTAILGIFADLDKYVYSPWEEEK